MEVGKTTKTMEPNNMTRLEKVLSENIGKGEDDELTKAMSNLLVILLSRITQEPTEENEVESYLTRKLKARRPSSLANTMIPSPS